MKICSLTIMRDVTSGEADDAVESAQNLIDGWVLYPGAEITDFSKVRNAALSLAASKGFDWALMLDTDERIHTNFPGLVSQYLAERTEDMLHVWAADRSYAKPRFFRLPVKGKYVGPTHECWVADQDSKVGTLEGITFSELPKTAEQYKAKAERDRTILEAYTKEHPDDPRWHYYLGDTYAGLGEDWKAAGEFRACWQCDGWDEESAWAAYRMAEIHIKRGDYYHALKACTDGMARHSGMAELPWLAGFCAFHLGRYQQAIWWEEMADHLNGTTALKHRINFRHEPALWEGPLDVMSHAYAAMGDEGKAKRYREECEQAMEWRLKAQKSRAPRT